MKAEIFLETYFEKGLLEIIQRAQYVANKDNMPQQVYVTSDQFKFEAIDFYEENEINEIRICSVNPCLPPNHNL